MQISPDSVESVTAIKDGNPNSAGTSASNGSSSSQSGTKTD
jgi:hypothetical protein